MFHRVLFYYNLLNVLRNMFLILSSITHMCLQEGKFWLLANVDFFLSPFMGLAGTVLFILCNKPTNAHI